MLAYFSAMKLMTQNSTPSEKDLAELDSMVVILEAAMGTVSHQDLFAFDPNSVTYDSLIILGFPEKLAQRMINYRSAGANFLVKSDLKKVYGFPDQLYDSLVSFINLPDSLGAPAIKKPHLLDLNIIDAGVLASQTQTDPALTIRIIRFRQALGGFISESQLAEVYGISPEIQTQIEKYVYVKNGFTPKKLKINKADEKSLKAHPYISDDLAEDILRYREINGAIDSPEELSAFKSANTPAFAKLISYLDFTN
jgi:DNA uptake protein ComE-like DNA-binding protein